MADLQKAAREADATNADFERLSSEAKIAQLGARIARISTHEEGFNRGFRRVSGSFTTAAGANVTVELSAYYAYTPDELDPESAHTVSAEWVSDGVHLALEDVSEAFIRDHTEKEVIAMLTRLDESVRAVELVSPATSPS